MGNRYLILEREAKENSEFNPWNVRFLKARDHRGLVDMDEQRANIKMKGCSKIRTIVSFDPKKHSRIEGEIPCREKGEEVSVPER